MVPMVILSVPRDPGNVLGPFSKMAELHSWLIITNGVVYIFLTTDHLEDHPKFYLHLPLKVNHSCR